MMCMMCMLCSCRARKEIGVVLFTMQYWPSCLGKNPAKQSQEQDQDIIAVQEWEGGWAWRCTQVWLWHWWELEIQTRYWFVREGWIFLGCHIFPPQYYNFACFPLGSSHWWGLSWQTYWPLFFFLSFLKYACECIWARTCSCCKKPSVTWKALLCVWQGSLLHVPATTCFEESIHYWLRTSRTSQQCRHSGCHGSHCHEGNRVLLGNRGREKFFHQNNDAGHMLSVQPGDWVDSRSTVSRRADEVCVL